MQLISLDNLAHRYGCLPSEALARGTTLDLTVLHVSSQWLQFNQGGDDTKSKKVKYNTDNHGMSQDQMTAMLNKARGK